MLNQYFDFSLLVKAVVFAVLFRKMFPALVQVQQEVNSSIRVPQLVLLTPRLKTVYGNPLSRGSFAFAESDKLALLSRCHRSISRLALGFAHRQKSDVRPKRSCSSSTSLNSCANNFQGDSIFDRSEVQILCQKFRPVKSGIHGSIWPLVTRRSNISHRNGQG